MSTRLHRPSKVSVTVLDRMIKQVSRGLTPDVAEALLKLRFSKSDIVRMNELAEKARRGTLVGAERHEAEEYNLIGQFVGLLQSHARRALKRSARRNAS